MESLNKKIETLELELEKLKNKVKDMSSNIEETTVRPYSKVGSSVGLHIGSMDMASGFYHLDGDFSSETGMWYAYAVYHD